MLRINDKIILSREAKQITFMGPKIRIIGNIISQIIQVSEFKTMKVFFKKLKEKNYKLGNSYPVKTFFKNRGEVSFCLNRPERFYCHQIYTKDRWKETLTEEKYQKEIAKYKN